MDNRVAGYVIGGTFQRRFSYVYNGMCTRRLNDAANHPDVFWSEQGNSYVVVQNENAGWETPQGYRCELLSINGMGELRWNVTSPNGNTAGDLEAAKYFGLEWTGWLSHV